MSSQHALSRPLLTELHEWWLEGVPKKQEEPLGMETFKRWFSFDANLDAKCRLVQTLIRLTRSEKYGPAVKEAGGMSTEEINKIVETPEDAVAVILLLDQMPRNIFRGEEAAKVYNLYDPKAAKLAKLYLQEKDYSRRDQFGHFARSMFLYMPLMHSEDLADHKLFASLLDARISACASEEERQGVERVATFEAKHREVLEKFGRYPSRNEALGRESTPEEIEHLKNGPGW